MQLVDRLKQEFKAKFGTEPQIFEAPGRINIIGEHTDYNNGYVLPASINRYIYLALAPNATNQVCIVSNNYRQQVQFDIHTPNTPNLPHWAKYPFGVVNVLKDKGYSLGGFNAIFEGDIPLGAGLSSSAALESAFAIAINKVYSLKIDKLTLAKIGQEAEHKYAGVMCGIMDQFATIHGKAGHAIKLDCRSLDFEYFPLDLGDYQLILIDTQVKHSLASSEYNRRRQECEEGVNILKSQMPQVNSLRDVRAKDIYPYKAMMGKEIFLRCEYVTEENERVIEACKALSNGHIDRVGELLYQTHEGLSRKYQVSCEELDLLVDTAKRTDGVIGARMMGGGFGGCTLNLVRKDSVDDFIHKATGQFSESFQKAPEFYRVSVEDGAREYI